MCYVLDNQAESLPVRVVLYVDPQLPAVRLLWGFRVS